MKEYIKKFESATSADNYSIVDIPFTASVAPSSAYPSIDYVQNLVCNQTGKKLVNNNGIVSIYANIPNNKIWYTTTDDEIYDLKSIIESIPSMGGTYNGPAVVSNEYDEEKQMYCMTFDDDVKVLGDINTDTMTCEGPFFVTNPEYGLSCNVETIILPITITRIGNKAFSYCSGLTSVTIPNSVTSIGDWAFYDCGGLTSIDIPNSVTSIGNHAFQSCTGLTSVTIPNSVTYIGGSAFAYCTSLISVICKKTTPPTLDGSYVFDNTNNCPIYVPSQSVDVYKASWSEYADRIVGLLNNNQIRYTANEQLTINEGVDYVEHTFDNGVGLVTFNNDLTTLEDSWFENTFGIVLVGNIESLTLPNGVSSIGMASLNGAGEVYYEGTQKECARIDKNWLDGTGVNEYHCFDGIVNYLYNSNMINPLQLVGFAGWLKDLIGEKTLRNLTTIISSAKIDENPMTAEEFISVLVNGTQDIPGLSAYGFTVITTEAEGVTIPLASHTSGHFIAIVKATDYAHADLTHIGLVAVNESLDPDYMYILLDDTAIGPEPTLVDVTIEHEGGNSETVSLYPEETYAEQGYSGYYSQNWYNSNEGEYPQDFLVDDNYPVGGETIYDYCNDTAEYV